MTQRGRREEEQAMVRRVLAKLDQERCWQTQEPIERSTEGALIAEAERERDANRRQLAFFS